MSAINRGTTCLRCDNFVTFFRLSCCLTAPFAQRTCASRRRASSSPGSRQRSLAAVSIGAISPAAPGATEVSRLPQSQRRVLEAKQFRCWRAADPVLRWISTGRSRRGRSTRTRAARCSRHRAARNHPGLLEATQGKNKAARISTSARHSHLRRGRRIDRKRAGDRVSPRPATAPGSPNSRSRSCGA